MFSEATILIALVCIIATAGAVLLSLTVYVALLAHAERRAAILRNLNRRRS